MLFQFPAAIQAGLEAGKYLQVFSASGVPLGMARDAVTGKFVGHAVGLLSQGASLNPLAIAPQLLLGAGQMYQNHLGLQALQALSTSVATLQATTAVIGVGTAATVALSAVNLWQTLKLREEVKQLRLQIREGFLDLKQALQDQGTEIIDHIDKVAETVEFQHHRTILVRAYGRFNKAIERLQSALSIQDGTLRNSEISAARDMLFQALADYDNEQLLSGISAAARLRRRECVWAIKQVILLTYQFQNEHQVMRDRITDLSATIRRDALAALDQCESVEELEFLFPEIVRIHDHDLAVLDVWGEQVNWLQSLPTSELKLLEASTLPTIDISNQPKLQAEASVDMPLEQMQFEEVSQKSHANAIHDSLALMMSPDRRRDYENYVAEQAAIAGFNALRPSTLQKASPLAISNLYWYFHSDTELEASIAH